MGSVAWGGSRDGGGVGRVSIWPRRRASLPDHARAWLEPDERVLSFAATPYGDLVVATQRGLRIGDGRSASAGATGDQPAGQLLRWEFIVSAKWAGDVLTVTSAEQVAPQIMKRLPAARLALPEPADLPRVVRQRVDRSVAGSYRRALGAGSTLLLVGRRVSGRDGLLWYAVFDLDSDADDPQLRRKATAILEAAAAMSTPDAE